MAPETAHDRAFCRGMLPRVSRTFALCIRLLPDRLRHSVLVAYLLCRIADTVEDTADLATETKGELLAAFGRALDGPDADVSALAVTFAASRSDEEALVHRAAAVLREFRRLPHRDQDAIRPWVQVMADGMAEFAARRARPAPGSLAVLASVRDLDRYCFYVAGTVGHLLTDLFRAHNPAISPDRYRRLDALAPRFGRGLQLTNIIKDVADDRRRGWSFVPRDVCHAAGLHPEELQDPGCDSEAREVMRVLIAKARRNLRYALDYCMALPARAYRIRLFCLTALYFAVRTLRVAECDPRLLDPSHKVKITRAQVYRTVAIAHLVAPVNALVRRYYRRLATAR